MKTNKRKTNVRRNSKGQFAKKKKLSLFKLFLIAILCLVIYNYMPVNEAHGEPVEFSTYYVTKGETLWSIASPYAEESNKDIRDVIAQIRKDNNNMSPELSIGQEIMVRSQY